VVYTSIPESEVNDRLKAEFTRQTGMEVDMLVIPSNGTVASRIRAEKNRPRADIYAEAPIDIMQSMAKDGLLEAYKAKAESPEFLQKGYADPNGFWHGWFALTTAIFWNTNSFKTDPALKDVKPPATWDGMLNPAYKGKIVLPNPQTTSIGFVLLSTQIFRSGEDKAWAYIRKLNGNVFQYTPSGVATVTLLEQGEGAVGAYWLADVLNSKLVRKQPIDFVVPPDNAVTVWAAGIVKGGPNPEGARRYIDFLESDFAQEVDAKYGFRTPLDAGVAPPESAPPLVDVKTVKYDLDWATQNLARLRKQWARETGQ